jgi:hypothetical protein
MKVFVKAVSVALFGLAFQAPSLSLGQAVHDVKIGNYFDFAPNGVAFVVRDLAAFVIDPGGDYYAGEASPDGVYHSSELTVKGVKVRFEWSRKGDGIGGRFTADQDVEMPIKLIQPWPDWHSSYSKPGKNWIGESSDVDGTWSVQSDPILAGTDPKQLTLKLAAGHPAHLVAGLGELPSLKSVDGILKAGRAKYESSVAKASGDWGDFLGAIADNLENSRVYSNDDHRLAISVSRRWADSPNTEPYFCWDSFFNGALSALVDPSIARDTVRAILAWQTPEGLVPNYGHWNLSGGRASTDRSQPPLGSLCVWRIQQRWPNRAFLAEVYPKLLKWHRWWPTARDGQHDGLLEWGSTVGVKGAAGKQGALWETGWDDTIEYEGAEMAGSTLNAYAVDLNSLWAMDADYLATIADALGKKGDAKALREERRRTLQLINEKLWNPELGIYCSRLWSGQFLTRLTPMNFYPLLAGAADPERAKKVMSVMQDPTRFWGQYVFPTVAYNDPVWHQQDYWRGKVWGPTDYLVWQGLQQYGDPAFQASFADKTVGLFMRNWDAKRVCGENYLSSTGEQSSDPHYTWGALLCLIGLESVCRIDRDGSVLLDGTQQRTMTLERIPIGGRLYTVKCAPGRTQLLLGRRLVGSANGKVARLSLKS